MARLNAKRRKALKRRSSERLALMCFHADKQERLARKRLNSFWLPERAQGKDVRVLPPRFSMGLPKTTLKRKR